MLGSSTQFTAAVVAGTNVSFTWAYGDGNTGAGATSAHTYGAPGNYTAIVTATNSTNSIAITTPVSILAADLGVGRGEQIAVHGDSRGLGRDRRVGRGGRRRCGRRR